MKNLDMTKGSVFKTLFVFMLPLLLGNIFQQLYNIVDTIVVGKFVSSDALGAVGAASPMVFLMIAVAIGLSMGCSIVISQYFGANDVHNMKKAIFTSMVFILGVSIVITILFLFISAPLLQMMQTPPEIYEDCLIYLQVFNVSLILTFLYNGLASILRAVGDSKTPLYFLILTTLLNIVLDLVFVVNLGLGVFGVALGTAISIGVSGVAMLWYVTKKVHLFQFEKSERVFDKKMLKDLLKYAIPSTVQQLIVSVSFIAIQGLVNSFGNNVVAGYTAATKIDNLALLPLMNISLALSTFVAQNIGANRVDRVKKGFNASILMNVGICAVITTVVLLFGKNFIGGFLNEEASPVVYDVGVQYISIVSIFYIVMAVMFMAGSVLRGAGDVVVFTTSTVINFASRIVMAYVLSPYLGPSAIWWSIPIGWGIGCIINFLRYKSGKWQNKSIINKELPNDTVRFAE